MFPGDVLSTLVMLRRREFSKLLYLHLHSSCLISAKTSSRQAWEPKYILDRLRESCQQLLYKQNLLPTGSQTFTEVGSTRPLPGPSNRPNIN